MGFELLPYLLSKQERLQAKGSGNGWRGRGVKNV
jgi:hypothetical protein